MICRSGMSVVGGRRPVVPVILAVTFALAGCVSKAEITMPISPSALSSSPGARFFVGKVTSLGPAVSEPVSPGDFLAVIRADLNGWLARWGILAKDESEDGMGIDVTVVSRDVRREPFVSILRIWHRGELVGEAKVTSPDSADAHMHARAIARTIAKMRAVAIDRLVTGDK